MDALRRELMEEAAVEIRDIERLGFVHLRHRTLNPRDHSYPYPDFSHVVFASRYRGDCGVPQPDDYEASAEFVPMEGLCRRVNLGTLQQALFDAARDHRRRQA